jgi:hypothetical protein
VAAGASGEESAWHDLIANFAVEPDPGGGDPPWPERENLAVPRPADPGPDTDPAIVLDLTDDTDPEFDFGGGLGGEADSHSGQGGARTDGPGLDRGRPGPDARTGRWSSEPRIIRPASAVPPPPPAADEEDFVPLVPPPLPSLDPMAKGAWAALFGGPAYLLVATMAGWAIPDWAAFLAVAGFVGGFATLVIRMGDRPPRDSGPDDGAVL